MAHEMILCLFQICCERGPLLRDACSQEEAHFPKEERRAAVTRPIHALPPFSGKHRSFIEVALVRPGFMEKWKPERRHLQFGFGWFGLHHLFPCTCTLHRVIHYHTSQTLAILC